MPRAEFVRSPQELRKAHHQVYRTGLDPTFPYRAVGIRPVSQEHFLSAEISPANQMCLIVAPYRMDIPAIAGRDTFFYVPPSAADRAIGYRGEPKFSINTGSQLGSFTHSIGSFFFEYPNQFPCLLVA